MIFLVFSEIEIFVENGHAQLMCNLPYETVGNYKSIEYQWFKDKSIIGNMNSTSIGKICNNLVFYRLNEKHNGSYTCSIVFLNGQITETSDPFQLNVIKCTLNMD